MFISLGFLHSVLCKYSTFWIFYFDWMLIHPNAGWGFLYGLACQTPPPHTIITPPSPPHFGFYQILFVWPSFIIRPSLLLRAGMGWNQAQRATQWSQKLPSSEKSHSFSQPIPFNCTALITAPKELKCVSFFLRQMSSPNLFCKACIIGCVIKFAKIWRKKE